MGHYYGMLCDGWSNNPADPFRASVGASDSYLCSTNEKFYFLKHAAGGLVGMFHKDVPTYAMRGLVVTAAADLRV